MDAAEYATLNISIFNFLAIFASSYRDCIRGPRPGLFNTPKNCKHERWLGIYSYGNSIGYAFGDGVTNRLKYDWRVCTVKRDVTSCVRNTSGQPVTQKDW